MTQPESAQGIVTSPHYLASEAGRDVLKEGGNAIEAAITVAATLAVVYPHMNSIGGDSFWLIRDPGGNMYAIDASGAASASANLALYRNAGHGTIPFRGPLAALTVAGSLSGWQTALELGDGTVPLARLLEPAISHAETGVAVTASGAQVATTKDSDLSGQFGYDDVFKPNGLPLTAGEILRQPALANTLRRLAKNGLQDFYTGALNADILADLRTAGSPLTESDFAAHSARSYAPLNLRLDIGAVYNLGPPTQGFSSLMILAQLAQLDLGSCDSFEHVHTIVEATKNAFSLSRDIGLGDRAYMAAEPQVMLDDYDLHQRLSQSIMPGRAQPWPRPTEPGDTVWFSAMDAAGWSVSAIQSTYFEFGSGLVLPQTGIIWQNRGASFQLTDTGWNALKPKRKPFHTLNPAMAVFHDGRTVTYGTMGGEGQPQTQAAIFSRYALFGMDLKAAIRAPRWLLGRTWGDESTSLKLENRFPADLIGALKAVGHEVEILPGFSEVMGHAGGLVRHPDGQLEGASDPRSDGAVAAC